MAKRSRMSVLKRQRELRKAEKAARKRAKRHGIPEPLFSEPRPTVLTSALEGSTEGSEDEPTASDGESQAAEMPLQDQRPED